MLQIKVLGVGCPRCQSLEANIFQAANKLGVTADIQKVTDIQTRRYGDAGINHQRQD